MRTRTRIQAIATTLGDIFEDAEVSVSFTRRVTGPELARSGVVDRHFGSVARGAARSAGAAASAGISASKPAISSTSGCRLPSPKSAPLRFTAWQNAAITAGSLNSTSETQ